MIEFKNSNIIIRNKDLNSTPTSYKELTRKFSIYDEVEHKRKMEIFTEINDDIYLPGTVSKSVIENIYPLKKCVVNKKIAEPSKITYNMVHQPRNDEQVEAIEFLTNIKNAESTHRMVCSNTGIGKTYCSINAISRLGLKAIIIVNRMQLAEQWKDQFKLHTDLQDDDFVLISGSKSLEDAKTKDFKIAIAQHDTLSAAIAKDPNSINEFIQETGIGIRVFDEVHLHFLSTCRILSTTNVLYNIYLTATPSRSSWKERILWRLVFGNVETYYGHVHEAHATTVMCKYDTKPTAGYVRYCTTKYGFSSTRYAGYVYKHCYDIYIDTLFKIFQKFKLSNKKVAVVLPTIDLIEKTVADLKVAFPDAAIVNFSSKTTMSNRQVVLAENNIIVTTEKMFGTGTDLSDLEYMVNYVQFASKVTAEQLIGRLRNVDGYQHILIDVTDVGFDACVKHAYTRHSVYKKKSKQVINVNELLNDLTIEGAESEL